MTDRFMTECFLCHRMFQFGPHIYAGRAVPGWGIMLCMPCYRSNWDGIVLAKHPHLVEHLKVHGIPIQVNEKGWLDIPRR